MPEKTLDIRIRAAMGADMAALGKHLQMLGVVGGKAAASEAQLGRTTRATTTALNQQKSSVRGLGQELQNLSRFGQLLRGVLNAFLLYKGFVFLQQQAIQFIGALVDLEHEIGVIQTQLNHLGGDFRPMIRQNILALAGETGVAMQELARTEYEVVSANIAVADSFEVLGLAAKAAVAGNLREVELGFNAALSQVNAFGLAVSEFDDVFDKQFQVIRRGIFTYEQFTTVVGTLSEAFASMGQDVETANAALASISLIFTGKQIERGATGLRNAILRISEVPQDFEEMGVQIRDAEGDFRNFIDIGRDLNVVLAGMSESARAATIKSLFPDERERRGINAFLGQLEEAEQFYIEQQFSLGSLAQAHDTVSESLKQQANIFQQDLIPAMEPFLNIADSLLGVFNGINDVLPGMNKNLLTTATVAAALGSAFLLSGGRFSMRQRTGPEMPFQGPLPVGGSPMGGARTGRFAPTGIGMAAGGLLAVTQFESARATGPAGIGGYAGAALSGAAMGGFLGGAPGAAIGAAVGLIATGLGEAFEKEAPAVAQSFSAALAENLREDASDVAGAIQDAFLGAGGSEGVNEEIIRRVAITAGTAQRMETREERLTRVAGKKGVDRFFAELSAKVRPATTETSPGTRRRAVDVTMGEVASSAQTLRERVDEAARVSADLGLSATETATAIDRTREAYLDQVAGLENLKGEQLDEQRVRRELINVMAESAVPFEEMQRLLQELGDGSLSVTQFFRALREVEQEAMPAFKRAVMEFNVLFTGEADVLADVFGRMGEEGEKLADVFSEIHRITQAFSLLEQLQAMQFQRPSANLAALQSAEARTIASIEGLRGSDRPSDVAYVQGLRNRLENIQSKMFEDQSVLESLGLDPTRISKLLTDRMLGQLGLIQGNFNEQDFVEALLGGNEEATQQLLIGQTRLADALFDASEAVRFGFIDGMGFSADQLEMFGEELQGLNRIVAQRTILEELRGIAEFAGVGTTGLEGAMDILRQDMIRSGRGFFELMTDPVRLAELLANMEFGDISVDQSTDYSISVRVSGDADLDINKVGAFADALIREINERNRNRMA